MGIFAVSFAAIFIRISEYELGPYATIFNRFWIASLALGTWVGCKQMWPFSGPQESESPVHLTRQDWGWLVAAGVITAIDLPMWAYSLTRTSVANATVLANLAPVFTALGVWLIWKHWFDRKFLLGLLVSILGAIAIGAGDMQLAADHFVGDAIALCSAVFFSAYLLIVEQLRSRLSATTVILGTTAVGTLVTGGMACQFEAHLFPVSAQGWSAVAALALVSQTLGQGLVAYSLNKVSAGVVSISFLLEPVMATLTAWVLFAEMLSVWNAIAFALVLSGVYIAISSQSALKVGNEAATDTSIDAPE
jgi:drug/metabolite transporter (DMT)-like permease